MRSYEDLQYAFQQLELAALYWEAGKLDEFIRNTGNALWGDEDFLYTYCCLLYTSTFHLSEAGKPCYIKGEIRSE